MKKLTLTAAAVAGMIATPLFAGELSADIDVDGNGTYSMTELQTAYPDLTEEAFMKIDINADGEADAAEVDAAITAGTLPEG